jgi:hypothetical protein
MKKNSKTRLFEVMGRLDKTFKPKLNEGFEEIEATDVVNPEMEEPQELTPEDKLAALTAKIDSLYAMVHGDEKGEESAEAEEEKLEGEPNGEAEPESEEKPEGGTGIDEEKKPKIPVNNIAKVGK